MEKSNKKMTERQPLSFSQGVLPRARPGTVSLRFLTSPGMFVTRPAGWREDPPERGESARRASGTLGTKKCSIFPATRGRQVTVTGSRGGKHEPAEPVTMKYHVQFEKEQEAEKNESFPFSSTLSRCLSSPSFQRQLGMQSFPRACQRDLLSLL